MARTLRGVVGGGIYHVLNRSNGRQPLFRTPADYDAFERVLAEALRRFPGVALLAYCLMPNHWHLVFQPRGDGDLPAFMHWLMVTHVRRHHGAHGTLGGGHLYQGRYKSFPVKDDHHFLIVCRYVEANARRAGLVRRARDWRWCSLHARMLDDPLVPVRRDWPVPRPPRWEATVDAALPPRELERVRLSLRRGRPFGPEPWVRRTARRLGLTQTLRPPGRPKGSGGRKK